MDISFQCAIRALAGLDSIAQTAGRCNRNGEADCRDVYIVNIRGENLKHLPSIREGQDVARSVLASGHFDAQTLLSPEAMRAYFSDYYKRMEGQMNYPLANGPHGANLYDLLGNNRTGCGELRNKGGRQPALAQAFDTAGRHFAAIEQQTAAVITPFKEGRKLIAELSDECMPLARRKALLPRAQQYSVNVYPYRLRQLEREGAIWPLPDGMRALDERYYNKDCGVTTQGEAMEFLNT